MKERGDSNNLRERESYETSVMLYTTESSTTAPPSTRPSFFSSISYSAASKSDLSLGELIVTRLCRLTSDGSILVQGAGADEARRETVDSLDLEMGPKVPCDGLGLGGPDVRDPLRLSRLGRDAKVGMV